jgi:hypothetical protein
MTTLHISHGAEGDDWFVVRPLEGESRTSLAGTVITHEMEVNSLRAFGRTVYELEVTPFTGGGVIRVVPEEA